MSVNALPDAPSASGADRAPVLRWLIFTGLSLFAAFLLWRYGLIRRMTDADRTYISTVIVVLYICSSAHCFWRTLVIARESEGQRRTEMLLDDAGDGAADLIGGKAGVALPKSLTSDHIRDLARKAATQGERRLDQTLLLRNLADRMRGSNSFGSFASDTLMKLGLLGTIIGFIIMLAPIAGLDVSDKSVLKSSMGVMSDGMAVAMYTTLAGLVGSILLKIQYSILDGATAALFGRVVRLTETCVVPALERRYVR